MSVKPGTGSEHPRTLPKHPGTYLEQPGTPPEHHQNTPEYPGAKKISNTKNLKIIPVNNQHVLSVTEKKRYVTWVGNSRCLTTSVVPHAAVSTLSSPWRSVA